MIAFNYIRGTQRELVLTNLLETGFFNLKNKAAGPRRYAFRTNVYKWTNPEGQVAFVGEMQAVLDGMSYQSSKDAEVNHCRYFETAQEAADAVGQMVARSLKRYAKLSQDPSSKIVARY